MDVRRITLGAIGGLAVSGALAAAVSASASPAVVLTTPGEIYGSVQYTLGFQFTVSSNQTIGALGVFDNGAALPQDAMVGLWDSSGDLLTSVTVPTVGATDIGDFAYASITPYVLTPGNDYYIGAYLGGSGAASSLNTGQGGSGSYNSAITVIQDQYSNFNSAFSFPGSSDGNAGGAWLGANFDLVPEPAAWTLMLVGISGLGAALRTRRSGRPQRAI